MVLTTVLRERLHHVKACPICDASSHHQLIPGGSLPHTAPNGPGGLFAIRGGKTAAPRDTMVYPSFEYPCIEWPPESHDPTVIGHKSKTPVQDEACARSWPIQQEIDAPSSRYIPRNSEASPCGLAVFAPEKFRCTAREGTVRHHV